MAGGAVTGGATARKINDEDDEKKSIIREKDQLVDEILDYLYKQTGEAHGNR